MKRAVLAIAAALSVAFGMTQAASAQGKPNPKADAAALARAPDLIAQAKITCTPTAAHMIGKLGRNGPDGKKVSFDAIEVACSEGLGYVLAATEKNGPVEAYDCIAQHTRSTDPKDLMLCRLPANEHPEQGLVKYFKDAGSTCQPTDARAIGATADGARLYEASCSGRVGEILIIQPGDKKPMAESCLAAVGGNLACKLTTPEAIETAIKTMASKVDPKCVYAKNRHVMTVAEGEVTEVSCTGGTGFLIISKADQVVNSVPCAKSQPYQGGCQLTDVNKAQTEEAGLYTQAARKAGYDCDVAKYGVFPPPGGGKEIVELACKNRPDGAIAIFSGAGDDQILNCVRSQADGYRCNYSQPDSALPEISKQLAAAGKGACVASGARAIGANKTNAYVEVSCADGNPGWVISYPRQVAKPNDIMSCAAAKVSGVGACDLAANKKASGG
jgi:hypothetical protein